MTDGGQRRFKTTLEDVDQGGRTAAELNRRLDELQAMEDLATLEDVLAEIRHYRRLGSATTEADDSPE